MKRILITLVSLTALFSLTSCTNDETYSTEQAPQYKVTFLNWDDSFLYETMVFEGREAHYSGKYPTKEVEENSDYVYEFAGWDQNLSAIYSDVTTKATYKEVAIEGWGPVHWF